MRHIYLVTRGGELFVHTHCDDEGLVDLHTMDDELAGIEDVSLLPSTFYLV